MNRVQRTTSARFLSEGNKLIGYASVFNSPTNINEYGRSFTEVISPTAFNRAIAEKQDCICCFNHNPERLLGRVSSGTLTLSIDNHGLRYEVQLPDHASDIKEMVQRGDLAANSFCLSPTKDTWKDGVRTIEDVDLFDVSPVVSPAYPDALIVGLRSKNWYETKLKIMEKSI